MHEVLTATARRIGLRANFQAIRRSFATLATAHYNEVQLTHLLGHSSVEVTRQYYVDAARLRIPPPPNVG